MKKTLFTPQCPWHKQIAKMVVASSQCINSIIYKKSKTMRQFNYFRWNGCFMAIIMLSVYCATAFGQSLRYENTKYRDHTGRDEPYSGGSYWEFNGDNLIRHADNGMKFYWQYHHNDGSYAVYYRKVQNVQPGYGYGPSVSNALNINDEVVVSSDRKSFCTNFYTGGNINTRGNWSYTFYYERRDTPSNKPAAKPTSTQGYVSQGYTSTKSQVTSSSHTKKTNSERSCTFCGGTGKVKRHIHSGGYGINNPKTKCYECGEMMSDGNKHAHYSCDKCRGTGKLKY